MTTTSNGNIRILVSSTSPAIQYTGDWTATTPTDDMRDLTLFNNYPFSDKLYGAPEGKLASLSYNFTGVTALRLHATINAPNSTGPAADAPWVNQCNVEPRGPSVVTETLTLTSGHENGYVLCDIRNLSPTETYTFSYTITVVRGQPVWFDRLVLDPSATANLLENDLIEMDHRHPSIRYDKDWENANNAAHIAHKPQSKMSVNFTGTSISWYDVWTKPWGMRGAPAAWTIDDKPFQMFTIPTIPTRYSDLTVQDLLFKTPELEPGPHRLEVTYAAEFDSDTVRPLALQYLVIQNGPGPTGATGLPSPSPTSVVTIPSSGSVAGEPSSAGGLSQGAKIGVGVGVSIAGLVILGAIAFLLARKRKSSPKNNIPATLSISDLPPSEKKL